MLSEQASKKVRAVDDMLKFLFWLLVGVYVYRRWIAPSRRGSLDIPPAVPRGKAFSVDAVRCRQCGMYVPRDEAIHNGVDWFCSSQHEQEFRHAPHESRHG
jgi:hypothetical protein